MKTRYTVPAVALAIALGLPYAVEAQTPAPEVARTTPAVAKQSPRTTQPAQPEATQPHFAAAVDAFAKQNYQAAAAQVHAAGVYVLREAAHAAGTIKAALNAAGAELESAAKALEADGAKAEKRMHGAIEKAKRALAMGSGSKASPRDGGA